MTKIRSVQTTISLTPEPVLGDNAAMRMVVLVMLGACGGSPEQQPPPDSSVPLADAAPPTITGLWRPSACRGGLAVVLGVNLEGGTGRINGVIATVAGSPAGSLMLSIPHTTPAGTGPILVETAGGTASSPMFTVIDADTPEITGNTPTVGGPYTAVTLTGTGLKDAVVQVRAVFPPQGGERAQVTSSTDTSLTFEMPYLVPGDYFIQAGDWPTTANPDGPFCYYGRSTGVITVP